MKDNAPEKERFKMIEWVRSGADADDYKDEGIDKIVETRCVACHNEAAGGALPNFKEFSQLKALTEQDKGATFASLTRVSHIHLFGFYFYFYLLGSFSQYRAEWV